MIAVTGLGAITALGATASATWQRLIRGERAFADVSLFPADGYRVRRVAEVQGVRVAPADDISRTSEFALIAAREALSNAQIVPGETRSPTGRPQRVGLVVGGSTAGMLESELLLAIGLSPDGGVAPGVREDELRRMLSHPLSAPTDRLARELGVFTRVRSLSSACSSGANAILVGATWLELGLVDVVLCGAADALCRITLSGFNALGALDPDGARPFDAARRGLTLGEGAGFLVLENALGARLRGQRAICSLLGWGAVAEGHHITNPEPSGRHAARAMHAALARAGREASDVDYVNAHGTGTPLNDPMESRALHRVFGERVHAVPVSSQKGQVGHTLAASGAIEAVFSAFAVSSGVIPPTGGLGAPDRECDLRHVRNAESHNVRVAISNSFGFGGMDTVLVFGRPDAGAVAGPCPQRVGITGVSVIAPTGTFRGSETRASCVPSDDEGLPGDTEASLEPNRARRLDRVSRLACVAATNALGEGTLNAGVVFGNAFGAVDRTSLYMRRLSDKGPRLVSPQDFPVLVPSSPAGFVSIYLGLQGATLSVADRATSGEAAFVQGWELVASRELDSVVVVAVEERSTIVDQVFRGRLDPESEREGDEDGVRRARRREGGAALALASESSAFAQGRSVLAWVSRVCVSWQNNAEILESLRSTVEFSGRSLVVLSAGGSELAALLEDTPWARSERLVCAEFIGSHEALGATALAIGAGAIAADPELGAVLCLGTARGAGYAIVLTRPDAHTAAVTSC
jgi:3-oxoacyl-[acyl-carrier-protein] synthase II